MPGRVTFNVRVTHTPITQIEADLGVLIQDILTISGGVLMDRVAEVAGVQRQTLRELALMGHPFSHRLGGAGMNTGLINRQSGAFFEGFRLNPIVRDNGMYTLKLTNIDEKAEMLRLGTPTMVARPYMKEISKGLDRIFVEIALSKLYPAYGFKVRGVR